MVRQSLGTPAVAGATLDELRTSTQFWLQEIYNHLDRLVGARGTPKLLGALDANGHAITNLPDPMTNRLLDDLDSMDAVPRKFATPLARQPDGSFAWDCRFIPMINDVYAEEDHGVPPLQQVRDLIQASELGVLNEPFVTATASGLLTAERTLTPEASVTTITDNGANSTIVVGVATNGIDNTKLRQGAATSVIGRAAGSLGNVADIAAGADNQVLARTAGGLSFTGTPQVTSISFGDEVLDTYDEATFTITGTGFTVNPTGTARYIRLGRIVVLLVPALSGTSNATTFTLTGIPAAIRAATLVTNARAIAYTDNSVASATPGMLRIQTGATAWDLYTSFASGGWTAANTKSIESFVVTYLLT